METLEVLVVAGPELQEVLVAELAELGFDAFLTADRELRAYAPASRDSPALRAAASTVADRGAAPGSTRFSVIPARNWNEEWERSAEPVATGRFLILPSRSGVTAGDRIPLWIEPKMSFGTGHHESTRLALRLMESAVRPGAFVLDAGTGTGILAIAAVRLGASDVVAFDIDEWSARNCLENMERNAVSERVSFTSGDLSQVADTGFDLVVANINRNALMELIPRLSERLAPSGAVIVSGLLGHDREVILEVGRGCGLLLADEAAEGDWWAGLLTGSET